MGELTVRLESLRVNTQIPIPKTSCTRPEFTWRPAFCTTVSKSVSSTSAFLFVLGVSATCLDRLAGDKKK